MADSGAERRCELCINPADEASNSLGYAIDRETCRLAMYQATLTYSLLLSLSLCLLVLLLFEILPPMGTRRKQDGAGGREAGA